MEKEAVTYHEHIHTYKMDDTTFFYKLWKLIAITVCIFVAIIAGCGTYMTKQKTELILKGSDPIAAKCSIEGIDSENRIVCILYISRQGK